MNYTAYMLKVRLEFDELTAAVGKAHTKWELNPTESTLRALNRTRGDLWKLVEKQARDAERLQTLYALAGHWQDASDQTVKLYQDDATRTAIVKVGDRVPTHYCVDRGGFDEAIDVATRSLES